MVVRFFFLLSIERNSSENRPAANQETPVCGRVLLKKTSSLFLEEGRSVTVMMHNTSALTRW